MPNFVLAFLGFGALFYAQSSFWESLFHEFILDLSPAHRAWLYRVKDLCPSLWTVHVDHNVLHHYRTFRRCYVEMFSEPQEEARLRAVLRRQYTPNVHSNIIAPTAWTRLIATIPVKDEAGAARMKAMQAALRPDQPAKLAVALASPAAKDVSGQIFGARSEMLELYSQPRPIETVTAADTWTVASILSEALPKMARSSPHSAAPAASNPSRRGRTPEIVAGASSLSVFLTARRGREPASVSRETANGAK